MMQKNKFILITSIIILSVVYQSCKSEEELTKEAETILAEGIQNYKMDNLMKAEEKFATVIKDYEGYPAYDVALIYRDSIPERRNWNNAIKSESIVQIESFLANYPNSKYQESAKNEIKRLKIQKEKDDWEAALSANRIIKYYMTENESRVDRELKAVFNNKTYTLISRKDNLCVGIEKIADFNKNGYDDVLVVILNGCGGNCCGDSYQIFSFNGQVFKKTAIIGYDYNGITISNSSNGYNFIVQTTRLGMRDKSDEMCPNKIENFRLVGYEFKLMNVVKEKKIPAIVELKSSDFNDDDKKRLFLNFDLDNDGLVDKITCSYWWKYASITDWKIQFGNGKSFKGDNNLRRIGILASKTKNVHDLVIDCDEILKWNGTTYE